ncbi:ParA family protein [Thiolinea disciformis]|uniref:ParA family protein n=1 Tax=Thiolinea disciformis TaxID=125614 RepID=UPI000372E412|nr:ParA family protein [Thiolinea disciformis]
MITVVGNLKGGTGKSTVAFNLALWSATRRNVHVVVYDLDPQATTSDAFEIRAEEGYLPAIKPRHLLDGLDDIPDNTDAIIDVGVSNQAMVEAALAVADRIIIPVTPSQADVWATQRFLKTIEKVRQGKKVAIFGLLNRADTHTAVRESNETLEALRLLSLTGVLNTRLYLRTTYRRSFSEGLAVFEMEPRSKAAAEVDALGRELYNLS